MGKTSGYGIDLQINAIPVQTKDFTWSTTLTWSMDRNRIDELSNGRTEDVNNKWFVGEEIGVYYDWVYVEYGKRKKLKKLLNTDVSQDKSK